MAAPKSGTRVELLFRGHRERNSSRQRPTVKDTNRTATGEPQHSVGRIENSVCGAATFGRNQIGDSGAHRRLKSAHSRSPERHPSYGRPERSEKYERVRCSGEQDACIAQQHVSGRVRPAGSPLTSPPDPGQTRRTRRTAGPVRRGRRPPGPGSAQEPDEPPLREAHPLGDAVPHASRSCGQYRSTGWRRQRALS